MNELGKKQGRLIQSKRVAWLEDIVRMKQDKITKKNQSAKQRPVVDQQESHERDGSMMLRRI